MTKIVTYSSTVPHTVREQVGHLSRLDVTSLSPVGVPPSNAMYPLYQHTLSAEILMYVERVGTLDEEAPVRLVVAFADEAPETVVGFVLYLPVMTDRKACGLSYMAVDSGYRRRGIARGMVEAVAQECPHIELTCFVDKVRVYESMGFHVIGNTETQIVLNNRVDPSPGAMAALWTDPIFESNKYLQLRDQLILKHGPKALRDAQRRIERQVDELSLKAKQYVNSRAQQIVEYRRPDAAVVQIQPGRFELHGVDGIACHSSNEQEVWIQAAQLINTRNEPELRVVREISR